jgi:small basic protein
MKSCGVENALCPITLNSFRDIKLPVAFLTAPHQPYECEELVIWLMERRVNPMTNLAVHWNHSLLEIIGPLRNCKVDRAIVCAYIDAATARCDNIARTSERRVFDWGFVSTFCFLLLISLLGYYLRLGVLVQVKVMIWAIAHSIWATKSVEGYIHFMCGIYFAAVSGVVLILGEKQSVPIEVATIFVFLLKISSRVVDVYAAQIRRALTS